MNFNFTLLVKFIAYKTPANCTIKELLIHFCNYATTPN